MYKDLVYRMCNYSMVFACDARLHACVCQAAAPVCQSLLSLSVKPSAQPLPVPVNFVSFQGCSSNAKAGDLLLCQVMPLMSRFHILLYHCSSDL